MKKLVVLLIILFILLPELSSQTYIPPGEVNGIWTYANSPYYINGEIIIPNNETLVIEPGVNIVFTGHFKMIIDGRLIAAGTPQDTIVFTAENHEEGWHGIRIIENLTSNDTTILEYCKLEYGKANTGTQESDRCGGAIYYRIGKLRVSKCLFQYNLAYHSSILSTGGGAIALAGGSPIIENCEFYDNYCNFGSAMIIWYTTSAPLIRNNYFHNNSGHGLINIGVGGYPKLINNYICNNDYMDHGLIHFSNGSGKAVFINNTIVQNSGWGGAIFENDYSDPIFINNIIWGNEPAQVNLLALSEISFINCLIQDGIGGFVGQNYFQGLYQNCIDADPEFENPESCRLKNISPCIGAGIDSINLDGELYFAPDNDYYGNPRPSPAGSKPDIGTYESSLANPMSGVNNEPDPLTSVFRLYQNYPNPFNASSFIYYQLSTGKFTTLKVYNILGKEMATLVDGEKTAGKYSVEINGDNLPSGVYFYQLRAGEYIQTKKMILMK